MTDTGQTPTGDSRGGVQVGAQRIALSGAPDQGRWPSSGDYAIGWAGRPKLCHDAEAIVGAPVGRHLTEK